jgi:hypothetical protein
MSLDDFLNSKSKQNGYSNSSIVDIPETASLLGKSASSFFDSLASQVGDGLSKIHKDTTNVASSAGKSIGVVKEDGSVSLFAPAEEDPILKHMTKKQRIVGFLGCIMMGVFCFSFAAALLPVLVVSSRKFALLFTLGSLFFIASFGLLKGPVIHAKSLMKKEKLPFTGAYVGSLVLTLYTACVLQSQFLTIFSSGIQLAALVYFFMSYIPGGVTGVTFMCKTMANMCIRLFPA